MLSAFEKTSSSTPIWIMRQAGRYLPEYKKVRSNFPSFMNFCMNPQASAEVTLQPLDRFDLDAAIIFSDILVVCKAMGVNVDFVEKEGPKLQKIEKYIDFSNIDHSVFENVAEAIKIVKKKINPSKALIGFAGSPFTVACYMFEGGSSKNQNFETVKKMMLQNEELFEYVINKITEITKIYLKYQIDAGIDIFKLFDSWSSIVPSLKFKKYVYNPNIEILNFVKEYSKKTKTIIFPKGCGEKVKSFFKSNCVDAVAIDQYTNISWAFNNAKDKIIQGNLDNYLLAYGSKMQIKNAVLKILHKSEDKKFIFNLGHGILPETPIENVEYLIDLVKGKCT